MSRPTPRVPGLPVAPDWVVRRPIAHRGLHDLRAGRPENSLAAFDAAVAAGFPIELDVQRLRDGTVVVFHDQTLERMTGRAGELERCVLADLAGLRLCGGTEPIPTLAEVLARVDGRVPLLIELKTAEHQPVGPLAAAVVAALAGYRGPVALQSFNPLSLGWLVRNAPGIPRGQLSGDFRDSELSLPKKALLRRLALLAVSRPSFVGYDLRALPYWAPSLARRIGIPLIAWTIRSEADLRRARRLADNVIFEGVDPRST